MKFFTNSSTITTDGTYGMYSCIQHEASTGYKSLRDIIVPTIQAALKKLQQTKDL